MLSTQQTTFDMCRCYLIDQKSALREDVYNLLSGWIRARRYDLLASCSDLIQSHDVTGAESVKTMYQVEAFFKKNTAFTKRLDSRLTALISFERGEELCKETNDRLDTFYLHPETFGDMEFKVTSMRRYIHRVLGDHSNFLREIPKLVRVTAGATATRSRRNAIPFRKLTSRMVCTPGAVGYLRALARCFGHSNLRPSLVSVNRVAFVPKSWKTERTIACEPDGNLPFQLAFDSFAKKRLHRVGVNLHDQGPNQELARQGSISDKLATIDLSMASDTLAYNAVALLLPGEWFRYLRAIRSQGYEMYPNKREQYHKFSSMGNGATFALETLVFAAACSAVGSKSYVVYGDDIIVESEKAEALIELLAFLGFVPNTDKTFISGPFRESCGKFWYQGVDITPRFVRDVDSRKATKCHLVNSLMTICKPWGALWDALIAYSYNEKLPLVPFNEDSMSGVWVDPHTAYSLKLIRTSNKGKHAWRPRCMAYKQCTREVIVRTYRTFFLWCLRAAGRTAVTEAIISSRYTIPRHQYRRKWVHWKPVAGAPVHLSWWSGALLSRKP